ncbi:MAG: hypothetical protein K8U57_15970 [Planctomycetes bacterium]|nr:hypothetical protein [Planctomycetota bacterium]
MFENAEVIHSYTRANALADGVLVDVSETAREAGIRFPVALTQARAIARDCLRFEAIHSCMLWHESRVNPHIFDAAP